MPALVVNRPSHLIDSAEVKTVEHPACDGTLSPAQEAFIEVGPFQCGYCTPGIVLMATQCHYLSGNLCRCAAHPEIVQP